MEQAITAMREAIRATHQTVTDAASDQAPRATRKGVPTIRNSKVLSSHLPGRQNAGCEKIVRVVRASGHSEEGRCARRESVRDCREGHRTAGFQSANVRFRSGADITRLLKQCPLYPLKRIKRRHFGMSAL